MASKLKTLAAAVTLASLPQLVQAASIEYWHQQTQSDRVKTIQVLIDTFEALNPDITVKQVAIDENDVPAQVAAAAAAGNLPNIIETATETVLAFADQGIIDKQTSTELVKSVGEERFFKGPLSLVRDEDDGGYYGVPYRGWIQGIWYRADWFEEAGLEPPTTWDNILKAAKHFNKPQENQYGILLGTQPDNFNQQVFSQFALSNGALLLDENGELVFNSPQMKETVEYYKELAQYTPAGPQTWRARDYYLQGKLAMMFYSTYIMDDLALAEAASNSLAGENFEELKGAAFDPNLAKNTKLAPVITNKQGAGFGSIDTLGVFKSDDKEELDATKRFIEFMYEPFSYITYLHMSPGGQNPLLRDIAEDPDYMNDPMGIFAKYGQESIQEILEGFDDIKSFTVVNGKLQEKAGTISAKQILPRMTYSVIFEGQSTDQAMAWAETEMQKVLK